MLSVISSPYFSFLTMNHMGTISTYYIVIERIKIKVPGSKQISKNANSWLSRLYVNPKLGMNCQF